MPDIATEICGVQQIALLTGMSIANVRGAKSEFGPEERGLDVVFDLDGWRLGAQHTVFHADEGRTPGKRGSPTRAEEEAKSRATQMPFGLWGVVDYRTALHRRINEKIAIAARHDNSRLVAETWLVVSASLNQWGAAASTMIIPELVRVQDLNDLCHRTLTGSNFNRAFLVLHNSQIVYGWNRTEGWRLLADPQAREREEHRARMADLIFNQIPRHRRSK